MENQLPQQPVSPTPNEPAKNFQLNLFFQKNLKIIIPISVAFIIVLILGAGFWAYKKGLLPFPLKNKTTVVEPNKQEQIANQENAAKPIIPFKDYDKKLQKGPFACPSSPGFCNQGEYKDNKLFGMLEAGTPLFAAFDGEAELQSGNFTSDKGSEKFDSILLVNKEKGLQAEYFFNLNESGKSFSKKEVKEGEELVKISGKPIKFQDNNSLTFQLFKVAQSGSDPTALTREDFK